MIKKQVVTALTETWSDDGSGKHRYVFRKQWYEGANEDKSGPMAVVITIRPTSIKPITEDLTMLLIEKHVRQLGFTGFIAVNLFSSIEAKNIVTFKNGNDENSQEVFQTVLAEKRIKQIIFACGSIIVNNHLARDQAKSYYELLTTKQKKLVKILVDSDDLPAHPLNVRVRKKWILSDMDTLFDKKE
ncbi:hypothetical protein A5819_000956 [Enterococcus sp. 7E2_DIV0204]|uniref:DUF1643 domain-containing protein n=1 Tax=unclassified Enterococcus TaxID=2608891 RepID=UPI000A33F0ED|nr:MULTISPECIES: DUF1643 domain-containing protein [unclassified Enterococcus]OTN88475.1 hypothetical protein A5819_000956 [Enterococcus sp. 7E2_DIV0204]OTP50944.1 hypothetical protein A5884_000130 [Enterococcus sp. 7D2_DIV0200]